MEEYIKIAVLENEIQAQLLDDILKEQNIPHIMRSYHDSVYNGLYQLSKGWGRVDAPEQYRDEILAILETIKLENPDEI
ncbi:MAG: hypothetical protein QME64_12070 [bacterium]|nr:hypothetical protein [bacterium]